MECRRRLTANPRSEYKSKVIIKSLIELLNRLEVLYSECNRCEFINICHSCSLLFTHECINCVVPPLITVLNSIKSAHVVISLLAFLKDKNLLNYGKEKDVTF